MASATAADTLGEWVPLTDYDFPKGELARGGKNVEGQNSYPRTFAGLGTFEIEFAIKLLFDLYPQTLNR